MNRRSYALGRLGTFISDDLEAGYRSGECAHDVRIARVLAIIEVLFNVPFGINDYVFQRDTQLFYMLMAVRFVNVCIGALVYVRMPSLTSARARDRMLLVFAAVIATTSIPIYMSRPPGFGGPLATVLLIIVAWALILPASFRYQLAAVSCLVVSFVTAYALQGPAGTAALVSTAPVLTLGVVLTLVGSLSRHRSKRELFLALHEQRTLRGALEEAIAEIRTLRGIVPICSYCHKIRDEAGAWHRVDAYVSRHTHAEFSHGFCPTCLETHFPEDA